MRRSLSLSWVWLIPAVLGACSDGNVIASGADLPGAGGSSNGEAGMNAAGAGASGSTTETGDSGLRLLSDGGVAQGFGVGHACSAAPAEHCRGGLECDSSGTCAFTHTAAAGSPCVAAGECEEGLQCAAGQCTPAGTGVADASCLADTDCAAGLRCGIVGFGLQCVPEGTSDVGVTCVTSGDCYAGLMCAPSSLVSSADAGPPAMACAPTPAGAVAFGIPEPPKLACDPVSTSGVKAFFEVPGAQGSTAGADFFHLPFPNDARITNGKIDLTGFPTPGTSLLGFDPVQIYLDAITQNESAWGTYATTTFRFSGPVAFGTFTAVDGTPSPVQYIDITDPNNPGIEGAQWTYSESSGKYVCHDWLSVRRPDGVPLKPGHVYTVFLSTVGRDKKGAAITRSPELVAVLGATKPADPGLANAYAAFKPLRDYLLAQGLQTTSVLNATVFTAGQVQEPMKALAAAVAAAPVPAASTWVKCGGGATSPCPQADGDRACGNGTADYDEYQTLVSLPIFQEGTPPYLSSGGGIAAAPVRTEGVCAAITVPKGKTMPAGGWPLVVFAHGTGGSYRDHVRDEVAGVLARATPPMAVIGYDQVQHGPRRGASTASPNTLFFNFANPAAARGNPMQGGADVISMGRFAKVLDIPGAVTGGADVTIDPNAVAFFGHSQGSMHGSLGLPYTNDYSAAVLSGNGASLMDALLTKTSPQNIAAAVPFVLGGDYDGKHRLYGGADHPVLSILQEWIDPADPLNFGAALAKTPSDGVNPKSVFQTYGIADTYAPPRTLATYAVAAGLSLVKHDASVTTPDTIGSLTEEPGPVAGNFVSGGHTVTLAVREYQNSAGNDGHFVVFDVPSANQDVVKFLSMAVSGQVPQVGD